ncbi:hypothetical protein VaNZ11_008851 [Volvox africanus]|uniref:Uncharacterized protein n=1 Tax=Volvox africanus TaxID=51714 RepID=A0ABQ5S692_9CHLO|nr:hypothetical protein VaNZ11_008851 [Volvox africanus]
MQVLRSGGPAALFSGLAPRLLQTTICSALFFTCFEASKGHLTAMAAGPGATVTPSRAPPQPEKAAAAATVTAKSAQEAATVVKLKPQGWAMPRLPPRQRWQLQPGWWRRRHRLEGSEADTTAHAAASSECWAVGRTPWADDDKLTPVALYAYAYAGAAVPAAAAAAVAAAVPSPMMFDFEASC